MAANKDPNIDSNTIIEMKSPNCTRFKTIRLRYWMMS